MSDLTWQKSSFSSGSGSGECVELASCGEAVCLRESDDPVVELAAWPQAIAHRSWREHSGHRSSLRRC
jgi:hypothetical protein